MLGLFCPELADGPCAAAVPAVPATIARLADLVPNDVTYVPDTTTLNGQPVGQPDNGVFPLIDRIRAYPTTLFLDAGGRVRAVYTGFSGPATGEAHRRLRQAFEARIELLLEETP